jgi:O-antigen/teichoic acid export membrane protein
VGLRGFASGSVWTMTRHVQIGKLTALNVSGDFAGFVVAVVWAIISPTAWALVVGRVTSSAVYMIGSHLVAKYPVSLEWDSRAAKDILAFGTGVFVSSATYFLSGEAERLFIAKFITIAELGCFALALAIATACAQPFSQLVGQVFYPMIAVSIRENRDMAVRHFKQSRTLFLWASVAVGFVLVGYGPRIVALLLPPKFAMAGWMLQWLGFRAAQQVYVFPASNLVLAYGDSKSPALSNTARFIMMTVGLWVAFRHYGLHQAVAVLALASPAAYLVLFPSLVRHLGRGVWFEISRFVLFLGIMALIAIVPLPWR